MPPKQPPDLALRGVMHDLNNVFETISEAAELLSGEERWAGVAAAIQRSVVRGRGIVSGLWEKREDTCDLDGALQTAISYVQDFFRHNCARNIEFILDIEPGLRLNGLPSCWERVLVNLFVNSGEAMRNGGTVEVSARGTDQEVTITVADNGSGIAPEILPDIFQPNVSTKSVPSGLGLHIVESIVRGHGGTVTAENRGPGDGARFEIRAPRA